MMSEREIVNVQKDHFFQRYEYQKVEGQKLFTHRIQHPIPKIRILNFDDFFNNHIIIEEKN